jgi:CubicO group peptidase (beta-lactamase class C family)
MTLLDDPQTSSYRTLPKIERGGGGLVSTAADYFRFAQMLANGGTLDGVRLLSPTTVDLMMSDHMNPEIRPDPMTSLYGGFLSEGVSGDASRSWGMGFGLTGAVVTDPALRGIPASKGTFGWGGAATTNFWVDREEELVGIVLTQLRPSSTYPIDELMEQLTYQAIID